jgi:hypothetical protein
VLLVAFGADRVNLLTVGERRYFLFHHEGRTRLVADACPHRGGPLHLSVRACDAAKLVCPWHETATPERRVAAREVPMVRVGTRACAVFDLPPETHVVRRWTEGAVVGAPAVRPRPRPAGARSA